MRIIRKIFKWLVIAILAFCILNTGFVFGFAFFQPNPKQSEAIVVMGAAINSPALQARTLKALELYENGLAPTVAFTGGKIADSDVSEAEYARKFFLKNTNQKPEIVMESKSGNTYENLKFLKVRLGERPDVIVVSDSYHLARSVLTAKLLGYGKVFWKSPKQGYYPKKELAYHYIREVVALPVYAFRLLTEKP